MHPYDLLIVFFCGSHTAGGSSGVNTGKIYFTLGGNVSFRSIGGKRLRGKNFGCESRGNTLFFFLGDFLGG